MYTKTADKKAPVPKHNKKPTTDARMERDLMHCFQLNGILYIPHYRTANFVGPGHSTENPIEYTAKALVLAGAQRILQPLWLRSAHASK
jgi:hypothetical protein